MNYILISQTARILLHSHMGGEAALEKSSEIRWMFFDGKMSEIYLKKHSLSLFLPDC